MSLGFNEVSVDVDYCQWSLFMDDGKLKTMSVVSLAEISDAIFATEQTKANTIV